MNLTFSKKDDFKKILTKSKPGLIRLAKELYIEDISDAINAATTSLDCLLKN